MFTLQAIFPTVTPVPGEPLRYWVQSRSRNTVRHLVDLTAYDGNGECECEQFRFKFGPRLNAGMVPGLRTECHHIIAAKRYLATMVARQATANEAKRGCSPSN